MAAVSYPGISFLRGYEPKDALEQFAKGYGFGDGIRNEAGAKDALSAYIDSLTGGQSQARPAASDALVRGSADAAEAAADPMLTAYFANTRRSESGGNDAARNPNSTATGRYQFLEGTWNDLAARHPQLGLTPDGRTDPNQQERAMKVFTQENARTLKGSGIPVNPGTLYAAHFLGPGGAAKVLAADPNAPVASMLDPSVVRANPQLGQMTVAQFQQWANEKGGNGSGGYAPPMAEGMTAQAQRPPAEVLKALVSNPLTREFGIQVASGKVNAGTDDIKEYQFAVQQGYQGSFADWQKSKAASTNVSVNTGDGSKKWNETLDEQNAKRYLTLQDEAGAAQRAVSSFAAMDQLLADPNLYSGAGGEGVLALKRAGAAMGLNPEGITSAESFNALSKQAALDLMGGSLGTGFSNADRDFVVGQVANLGNTPEGNRQIIGIQRKLAERKIQIAALATEYVDRVGQLDSGFDRVLRQFAEANPLFPVPPPDAPSAQEAPSVRKTIGGKSYVQINGEWYEE